MFTQFLDSARSGCPAGADGEHVDPVKGEIGQRVSRIVVDDLGWGVMARGPFMSLVLLALLLAGMGGCKSRVAVPSADAQVETRDAIILYRHPMEIRLSKPASMPLPSVLVLYATGDGGWRGVDGKLFGWIASSGWPIAGFSSKDYLKNLGYFSDTATTTPRRLVRDYRRIIDFARNRLGLPEETQILYVGNSRGAGLSVVAAGQGELKRHLAGVIAIALTREEEHVLRHRAGRRADRGGATAGRTEPQLVEIKTYEYLPRLSTIPVCVLQSTNDGYLPAASARQLFGPDSDYRKLRPIEARNHSFSGGNELLHNELLSALHWISPTTRVAPR